MMLQFTRLRSFVYNETGRLTSYFIDLLLESHNIQIRLRLTGFLSIYYVNQILNANV